MIKLIALCGNNYRVICPDYKIFVEGNLDQAKQALWYCGVEIDEVLYALEELHANSHDVAEFGINKMFVFSIVRTTFSALSS